MLALAVLTYARNRVYESNLSLWTDTLAKLPERDRARAHNNLANALIDGGRPQEAIPHCIKAVRLKPDFPQALNNHGYALAKQGDFHEALKYYDQALRLGQAGMDVTLDNRGYALYNLGRYAESIKDYRGSLVLRPGSAETRSNYANVLIAVRNYDEALRQLDESIRLDADFAPAWNNRGNVFAALGANPAEALRCYKKAVALDPSMILAIDNVARYSVLLGRPADALPYFEMQARLAPADAMVQQNWGNALMLLDREADAIPRYQRALELNPKLFSSRHNLALALLGTDRPVDALPHFEKALALQPGMAPLRHNYAKALAKAGRLSEAIAQEREALRIQPDFTWARQALDEYTRQNLSQN